MQNNAALAGFCAGGVAFQAVPALSYGTLKGLIAEMHPPTAEHSIRTRICATRLAQTLNLPGNELNVLSIAAELHDIGKIYLPRQILDKGQGLTESDWQIVRQHPLWGAVTAERSFPALSDIAMCIRLHHERLDGSGYPFGLLGCQIPYLARIVAIADAFAALTEERPYRPAYTDRQALHILFVEESGRYDEELLSALASYVG